MTQEVRTEISNRAERLIKSRHCAIPNLGREQTEPTPEAIAKIYAEVANEVAAEKNAYNEAQERVDHEASCQYCETATPHPPEACAKVPNDIMDIENNKTRAEENGTAQALPEYVQKHYSGGLTDIIGKCVKSEDAGGSYINVTIEVKLQREITHWHVVTILNENCGHPETRDQEPPRVGETVRMGIGNSYSPSAKDGNVFESDAEVWTIITDANGKALPVEYPTE